MIAFFLGLPTISPRDAQRLFLAGTATPIDVNSMQSWQRARVPGARNLHPTDFQASDLPVKERTLVFYCSNPLCRKAPLAARRARKMGHADVRVMSAGITGWMAAQLPIESGVERRPAA